MGPFIPYRAPPTMDQPPHIQQAIEHLDVYGYCVLPGLLPTDWCADFAAGCLRLHADEMCRPDIEGDGKYQTLFGMLNRDERTWRCASQPSAVAVARHFLGDACRVVEACSKPTWPGCRRRSRGVR